MSLNTIRIQFINKKQKGNSGRKLNIADHGEFPKRIPEKGEIVLKLRKIHKLKNTSHTLN